MPVDPGKSPARSNTRFALLTNGANFGREVLRSLLAQQYPPALLVLPEYPPAAQESRNILVSTPIHQLQQLAPSIETGFAPAPLQAQCAALLRQRAIDFILVACWPYLINAVLLESAARAALNLHPSMLPAYRGPDPIAHQLADGHRDFGVSLHLLNRRFDQGDIVSRAELREPSQILTRSLLEQKCASLGSKLFIDALNGYDAGWKLLPQTD
jgi:methionyl-tRNA formyltransferase